MKRILSLILAMVLIMCVPSIPAVSAQSVDGMEIYGLYLGASGDSTLLNLSGNWLLVDTGDLSVSDQLINQLEKYGVKALDIYISHLHPDHYGGVAAVGENFDVNNIYLPDESIGEQYSHQQYFLKKVANESNADNVIYLKKGDKFSYGSCKAEVLGPVGEYDVSQFKDDNLEGNTNDESHYLNNCSLTTMFTCGETSFLSCGDIEAEEETALLKYYKNGELDADVLKLSHHGLPTSNTEKFLKAVSPEYSFALSTGYHIAGVRKNVAQYGLIYMVGDEKEHFGLKTDGRSITVYKNQTKLSGWVALVGGNGIDGKENKYYIKENKILTGIQTIDGKKYHFSTGGCMETGYYDNSGSYILWNSMNDGMRAFSKSGEMYTGFKTIDGNMFYFDTKTGIRKTGTANWDIYKIGGKYYALNKNGVVKTNGWKTYKVNSKTNYRYFDKNGVMKTSWFEKSGKKYYLNKSTGLRTLGLKKISGKYYYFVEKNSAGYAYTSGWKKFGSKYRYFDKEGVMKTGWLKIGSKKYYLSKSNGYRAVGLKKISGKYYYFVEKNKAAYMYTSGWKKFGSKYRYFGSNGKMYTGWKKIKGNKYYFDKNGYRVTGTKKINGKTYKFSSSGKLKK